MHFYTGPQDVVSTTMPIAGHDVGDLGDLQEDIHHPGYGFPGIPLLGNLVNKNNQPSSSSRREHPGGLYAKTRKLSFIVAFYTCGIDSSVICGH